MYILNTLFLCELPGFAGEVIDLEPRSRLFYVQQSFEIADQGILH